MSSFSSELFEFRRNYEHTMSQSVFVLTLSALIAGGLAMAGYVASITYSMQPTIWWLLGYFIVALPGVYISATSDKWTLSSLGYVMVIAATGAITGPYVNLYQLDSVIQVAMITIGTTIAIGFAGAIYPKSVEHWGGFLLAGLLVLIFGDLAHIFMLMLGLQPVTMGIWDWVGAFLFTAFIFYDMNRAMRMDFTLDNAVDAAVALYLDIINLFVRLLAVMGKAKDRD